MRVNRKLGAAVSAVAVVAAAGVAYGGYLSSASGAPATVASMANAEAGQVASVRTAFADAIKTDYSVGGPPSGAYSQTLAAALRAGKIPPAPSAAMRSAQLASGEAALARYFTSAQAKHQAIGLRNVIAYESHPNSRNIGAGAKDIKFLHVAVAGGTATVEADVTVWSKTGDRQSSSGPWILSDPSNVMQFTADLVLDSAGQWRVSSLIGKCVSSCP